MADTNAVLDRLEAVCARLEAVARKGGAGEPADPEIPPEGLVDYQAMWEKEGKAFLAECGNIGYPDVEKLTGIVNDAFLTIQGYMALQNKVKKPTMQECCAFNQKMLDAMKAADDLTRTRDRSLFKFDLMHKALYETIMSCTWVSMYPPQLPAGHAKAQLESCDFHLNRIMMKEQEKKAWAKACKALLKAQADLVKQHYKMGIEFEGKGSIADADSSAPAPAPVKQQEEEVESAPKQKTEAPKKKKKQVDPNAMFAELNQGLNATSGLKKVKKSQKNKYNRANIKGTVSAGPKKAKAKKKMPDPKKYKQGPFTWFYQYYQEGLTDITEDDKLTMKNGLYICNSLNCQFRIAPKVKSVVVDSCQRVQLEINDVVSAIELVNCKNVTIWCMGVLPSITIDKCESPKIIFTDKSWNQEGGKHPQVVYSNVTAANIEIPGDDPDADRKEIPLVEQFELHVGESGHVSFQAMEHGD